MRALAAHLILEVHPERGEITKDLNTYIEVHNLIDAATKRRRSIYVPSFVGLQRKSYTSLHRAKNAIRRHFGIERRSQIRWTEETR